MKVKNIIRYVVKNYLIYLKPVRHYFTMSFIRMGGVYKDVVGNGSLQSLIDKAFDLFGEIWNVTRENKDVFINDMIESYVLFHVRPIEYFLFRFPERSISERIKFLPVIDKDRITSQYVDPNLFNKELEDKYCFYLLQKKYFKRDVFLLNANCDKESFRSLFLKHEKLFFKPLSGQCGQGACLQQYSEDTFDAFWTEMTSQNQSWIAEEVIEQTAAMSAWNQSSVNTIRIPAFLVNNNWSILAPFIRTGRKGAIVDNGGAGGVFAALDEQTGMVTTDGVDELGHTCPIHPDSGIKFKGWQVPSWQELLRIAEEAHRRMPLHKYLAFDFALTDVGWVLLEGNHGAFLGQYATNKGIRNEFIKKFKKL